MKLPKLKRYLQNFGFREVLERPLSYISPGLEVVRLGDSIHLNASHTNYSYGGLHRVFQKAFREVSLQNRKLTDVLILGFGAGSVASIISDELQMLCNFTAVEIDPEVIRLGKEYFNTGRFETLIMVEADASDFIENDSGLYDLIVVDVYIDFEVPASCESMSFVQGLYERLLPGGMVIFNKLVYNHEAGIEATELERKFNSLQGRTSVVKVRESVLNKIIVFEKER
ncbi:MAG TPA: hypothetical protein VK994_05365 [Bacteroidales bacterium]|nr:hypothetical protein [Bacteroidales bacterium]